MNSTIEHKSEDRAGPRLSAVFLFYGILCLLALWALVLIPSQVGRPVTLFGAAPEGLAPDAMPRAVLIALVVLSGIGCLRAWRAPTGLPARPPIAVVVLSLASFGFAALLVPLGFVLASALTVAFLSLYLGARGPVGLAVCAGGVPILLYGVFTRVLHISLPAGPMGF